MTYDPLVGVIICASEDIREDGGGKPEAKEAISYNELLNVIDNLEDEIRARKASEANSFSKIDRLRVLLKDTVEQVKGALDLARDFQTQRNDAIAELKEAKK